MAEQQRDLTEQWRDWVNRPPRRSPAQAAMRFRADVAGEARQAGLRPGWWPGRWLVVAACTAVVVAAAITGLVQLQAPAGPVTQPPMSSVAPALGSGQVLLWLDADTPLYMTFQTPAEPQAGGGER